LHIEIGAEHIAAMVVMPFVPIGNVGCTVAKELETVVMPIPVKYGNHFQLPVGFPFYRCENGFRIIELIGIRCCIKRIGSVIFVVVSQLQIECAIFYVEAALP
jgi:hypothetical protein